MRNDGCEENSWGKENNTEIRISKKMDRKNSLSIFCVILLDLIFV